MTRLYAVYKKFTSNVVIWASLIQRDKSIYHVNITQRKAGLVVLLSDKVDFRAKKIIRQRKSLGDGKRITPPRRHSIPKCV